MNFGSKYIYNYDRSESESVSEDEELDVNDHDDLFIPRVKSRDAEKQIVAVKDNSAVSCLKRKRLRKPDTNVLSIKFNRLLLPGEMHAGDPVYCNECKAIGSHLSSIEIIKNETTTTTDDDQSRDTLARWQCEYCSHVNTVDIEQTDLPRDEDATYLLTPAPVVHGSDMTGIDDSMVFFLIDISGSMSSTTLVQGIFNLPNADKLQARATEAFGGAHMIRQQHQTYVTRLQGVQMAVDANLDKLVKDSPTKRAALLAFNHEITYYGDGTKEEPLVIRGDKLNSAEDLLREAERELNNELKSVAQTKTKLTERIYDLEEGGQTALGPSIAFALNIASKRQGSRIVICTDGLANRGLGNLETAQDEKVNEEVRMQALDQGNQFYADLTERAREKGVSISVITIKGTTCLLPVIGQMADGTGGNVTIVDLLNMRDEFASILEQQVIATNVEATLIVHRGLYIRSPDDPEEKLEKIKRDIGNVTKQTEVTFEFGVRNKEELKEKYNIDFNTLKTLPFQIQVIYTAADGSKALRVLTQSKESTADRHTAEVNAVRSVIAENHIRSTATDMMAAISDDEEQDATRVRSKWSTPVVQKQRLAYMDNLNQKVRSSETNNRDQFNERRWIKASSELKSQVISTTTSRSQVAKMSPAIAAPAPKQNSTLLSSIGDRVSRLFSGSNKEETSESSAIVPRLAPKRAVKRSYGFATTNLSHFSDQNSENLYRYKNMSSDYMRDTSPTREDEEELLALTSGTTHSSTLRKDGSDHHAAASRTDRFKGKRVGDDEPQPPMLTTGRFEPEQHHKDDKLAISSDAQHSEAKRHKDTEKPAAASDVGHPETKKHDDDNKSAAASDVGHPETKKHDDDNKSAAASDIGHPETKKHDDDNKSAAASDVGHPETKQPADVDKSAAPSDDDRMEIKEHDDKGKPAASSDAGHMETKRHDNDERIVDDSVSSTKPNDEDCDEKL